MNYIQSDFERIYKLYYPKMFGFAKNYVLADEDAENIVQDVFLVLWEKKDELEITYTLTTYYLPLLRISALVFCDTN